MRLFLRKSSLQFKNVMTFIKYVSIALDKIHSSNVFVPISVVNSHSVIKTL